MIGFLMYMIILARPIQLFGPNLIVWNDLLSHIDGLVFFGQPENVDNFFFIKIRKHLNGFIIPFLQIQIDICVQQGVVLIICAHVNVDEPKTSWIRYKWAPKTVQNTETHS
ncbi:hypothetical protein ACJX0J_031807 [Zea mays]